MIEMRWLRKQGTSTEPDRLQYKAWCLVKDEKNDKLLNSWEWQDVPVVTEP